MSALRDIRAAVKAAPPLRRGWERIIFLGLSAEKAVSAEMNIRDEDDPRIGGIEVVNTIEFAGWALREIDPKGQWHEVDE